MIIIMEGFAGILSLGHNNPPSGQSTIWSELAGQHTDKSTTKRSGVGS